MKRPVQIFLSYARQDKEKIENLYLKLSDVGFKPWMDTKDILPGERWRVAIEKAIHNSEFFLACLSTNSVNKRGFLQREIKDALDIWEEKLDSDIVLIPARIEDCEVPESLSDFQRADLFEEGGWSLLVKAIQEGVKRQTKTIQPVVHRITISEAINLYLKHVKASQSLGTARTYTTGLRHFRRYLLTSSLPPDQTEVEALTLPLATGFITWLYDYLLDEVAQGHPEKISESTKGTYFAAISGFFEYLIIESQLLPMSTSEYDVLRKALAKAAKPQRRDELPPDKLPSSEIVEVLLTEALKPLDLPEDLTSGERRRQELARLRDIAILQAFVSSGMRVGELVRLERGHLLYDIRGAVVKYAKGKKEREVLFSEDAWSAIQTYLKARQDSAQGRPIASLPVFARHDRRAGSKVLPLSTRSVQNIFFEIASRADILERFHLTPHTLRHFFATEFLSETGDLALTQYALGHSSPTTTRIYAQTKRDDYRRAHRHVFGSKRKSKDDT